MSPDFSGLFYLYANTPYQQGLQRNHFFSITSFLSKNFIENKAQGIKKLSSSIYK